MNAPEPVHALLQHQGFLRALARRLVAPDEVEDLAQDTWVRALERPPRSPRSVGRWLRTVTRNLASNRHRQEGGRSDRERTVARDEAIAGVDEGLAQAELLRNVLDAVLALEEPYRATIVARYFRGLSAAEIADETKTSIATIRSREQRALARLRERLDGQRGGDRAAWATLLARWVERAPRATVAGPLAALRTIGVAAGVGLAGLVAVQALRASQEPPAVRVAETAFVAQASVLTSASSQDLVASAASVATLSGSRTALPTISNGSTEGSSSSGGLALQAQMGEVRGRILLPDGQPSVGQTVQFAWEWSDDREGYTHDAEVLTEADGRFSLRYEATGPTQFAVVSTREGFVQEDFCWDSERTSLVVDLGVIVLRPTGRITGTVVDDAGQPVVGESLEVVSRCTELGLEVGESDLRLGAHFAWASVDPFTGSFALEELPEGRHKLTVRRPSDAGISTTSSFAKVLPGATTQASAVWSPPTADIRLVASSHPIFTVRPDPAHVRLSPPATVNVVHSSYTYTDLPEGPFTLEIDDPRFVFWQQSGVQAGDRVFANLQGSSTVVLDVRDASGQALLAYAVAAKVLGSPNLPNRFDLHDGSEPLTGGRVEGLVPGDYEILVTVPELGTSAVPVPNLAPGETRAASVTFATASALSGQVQRADGSACAGIEVLLLEPAVEADSATSRILRPTASDTRDAVRRHQLATAWTDSSGAFAFGPLQPGHYAVHASDGFLEAASAAIEIEDGSSPDSVVLVLPTGATLATTLTGLGAGDEMTIVLLPTASPLLSSLERLDRLALSGGAASIGPRPPGTYRVDLGLPGRYLSMESSSNGRVLGSRELGTVVLTDGETTAVEYDVAHLRPGTVSVLVLENGKPGAGLTVGLLRADWPKEAECSAIADAEGRVTLPAFPGDYVVRAAQGDRFTGAWIHQEFQDLVHVVAGSSTSVVVDFTAGSD